MREITCGNCKVKQEINEDIIYQDIKGNFIICENCNEPVSVENKNYHPWQIKAFEYLDELRESGQTNMFGAGQYLEAVFSIDKREAQKILKAWMDTFEDRHKRGE